ncbi:MAG: hypothetical protein J1E61_03295 [Lachnospiraceae bacterium]|nr:hypothetical protein [Lachnospiraceae bacterium]
MIGKIAVSMAGHDKGKAYVIVREDAEYVYLCDGRWKLLEKAKKKKKKHIALNKSFSTGEIEEKLRSGVKIYDHEIRSMIKQYEMKGKKAEV